MRYNPQLIQLVLDKLAKGLYSSFGTTFQSINWKSGKAPEGLTEEGFNVALEKAADSYKAECLQLQLTGICDRLQQEKIIQLLGKHRATKGQLERYERKYSKAKNAEPKTEEDLLIIDKHHAFLALIDQHIEVLEALRQGIDDLIKAGQLDTASSLIEKAEGFTTSINLADVEQLLQGAS